MPTQHIAGHAKIFQNTPHPLPSNPLSPPPLKPSVNLHYSFNESKLKNITKKVTIYENKARKLPPLLEPSARKARILFSLYEYGHLTTEHIHKLHWAENSTMRACQIELQAMCSDKLIRRISQPTLENEGRKPYIYHLERRGAEIVSERIGMPLKNIPYRKRPNEERNPQLPHSFGCAHLRIAFEKGAKAIGMEILAIYTDTRLKKGSTQRDRIKYELPSGKTRFRTIVQDLVIKVRWRGMVTLLFWEYDRYTESLEPTDDELNNWREKYLSYMAYFESKEFVERYGDLACRVLIVGHSEVRLNSIIKVISRIKTRDEVVNGYKKSRYMFWFNHFEHASDPKQVLTRRDCWTHICGYQEKEEMGWGNQKVKVYNPVLSRGCSLLEDCSSCVDP